MRRTTLTALLVSASVTAALTGCASTGSGANAAGAATANSGTIAIVASTDVYGDIAKQIGGSRVAVTSIITDPSQDPHSYEADAQVQLSLSKADIVIQNGGGYDDFVDTLLKGANNPKVTLLNAAAISGYDLKPTSGEFNEHLWYDFPSMEKVATRLVSALTKVDAAGAGTYTANAAKFTAALHVLEGDEAAIKKSSAGAGVAITEPVPLYLLEASGLVNKTPEKFSEAIEAGTDVSPVVLQQTLRIFSEHSVKLLAYNEQTTGAETQQVLAAAKTAGIAIVPVTETLPDKMDYLTWMTSNLTAIKSALQ